VIDQFGIFQCQDGLERVPIGDLCFKKRYRSFKKKHFEFPDLCFRRKIEDSSTEVRSLSPNSMAWKRFLCAVLREFGGTEDSITDRPFCRLAEGALKLIRSNPIVTFLSVLEKERGDRDL
jgi:hypothetical protein